MAAALVDWAPTDKWMLTASYAYRRPAAASTSTRATLQAAGGFQGGPLVNYVTDNTTLQRFQIKGTYNYNKNVGASAAGYAYEKYDYSDGQMAGYASFYPYFQNLNTAASVEHRWYSGAFANPSYTTNLVWLTVTYKFDSPLPPIAPLMVAEAPPKAAPPPPPPPPPPAPAAAGPAGAEDHARLEGAVRLRQGGAQARRQGRDRQPGRRQARADPEARSRPGDRPHRPPRHRRLQPEAVGAPRRRRARLPGQQGRAARTRSRRSAWARSSRSCSAIRRT